MFPFQKEKDYLICIDSDGTIMDTMTVKHEKCFGPQFLSVMNITDHKDEILTEWLNINLYSLKRGINRFQGFDQICHFIKDRYNVKFKGLDEFDEWINKTKEFSVNSILAFKENVKEKELFEKALLWSKKVNESISKLPPSKPFKGVKEDLDQAALFCDLVGVSSANKEAVKNEWERYDLIKNFRFIGCQDCGNKTHIISQALENGYQKKNALMLGDALGDYQAAKENGILFFPIIPKKEEESWIRFKKEGLIKLLAGEFDEHYQNKLFIDFKQAMNK